MYKIVYSRRAIKRIKKLDKKKKRQIKDAVDRIAENPYLGKKLAGEFAEYRSYRSGDYRIVYGVIENKITIYVLAVGNRKDIYDDISGKIISLNKFMLGEGRKRYRKKKRKKKKKNI